MAGKESGMTTVAHRFAADFLSFDKNNPSQDATAAEPSGTHAPARARTRAISLAGGLDFVFVHTAACPPSAQSVRLFTHQKSGPSTHTKAVDPMFGKPGRTTAASESGQLVIEETSSSGSVPKLFARNPTSFDYLLLAGQIVRGGKQNRGINADILIGANSSIEIPVTCVEQGRWSHADSKDFSNDFSHGGFEPPSVRSAKMRSVHARRRVGGAAIADQSAVWDEISVMQNAVRADSASNDLLESITHARVARESSHTQAPDRSRIERLAELDRTLAVLEEQRRGLLRALQDVSPENPARFDELRTSLLEVEQRSSALRKEQLQSLRRPTIPPHVVRAESMHQADIAAKGACGLLLFFHGNFVSGDIFANPDWFASLYGDLRDAALLSWDVLHRQDAAQSRRTSRGATFPVEQTARTILRDALAGDWDERTSIGSGRSLILNHPFIESSMIVGNEDTPLHILLGTTHDATSRGPRTSRRLRSFLPTELMEGDEGHVD
jgi:hypothetical protein